MKYKILDIHPHISVFTECDTKNVGFNYIERYDFLTKTYVVISDCIFILLYK